MGGGNTDSDAARGIVDLLPVSARIDALFLFLANTGYLSRRRFIKTRLQAPIPPRFHYKFRALQRTEAHPPVGPPFTEGSIRELRTTLVDSLLWMSSPMDFNDPFDTWVSWKIVGTADDVRAKMTRLAEGMGELSPQERATGVERAVAASPEQRLEILRASFAVQRQRFGVCSFGSDPREVLMWSHYAGSHAGVCLQFETARDPGVFARALPVSYVESSPVVNWLNDDALQAVGESFTRKHARWRYEGEHRIIQRESGRRYIRFRPDALTGIVFGCKADGDVKRAVAKLLTERRERGFPRVKLYYSRQHEERNEIQIWGDEDGPASHWTGRAPIDHRTATASDETAGTDLGRVR